jgi:hypothetical protein
MTSKEKAEELIMKYFKIIIGDAYRDIKLDSKDYRYIAIKQCALIAVNEILEATKKRKAKLKINNVEFYWEYSEYWQEVKNEIKKL